MPRDGAGRSIVVIGAVFFDVFGKTSVQLEATRCTTGTLTHPPPTLVLGVDKAHVDRGGDAVVLSFRE
jgi:hypothetical protein